MKGQNRMQWSFSGKASSPNNSPQLLSFMSTGDDQSGTASRHRMTPSGLQGTGVTTYQVQSVDRYNNHQSKETRILPPVHNHNNNGNMYISMSSSSPNRHNYSSVPFPPGQDTTANSPPFVGAVPVVAPSTPGAASQSSMVGTTDLRNNGTRSSPSSAPAQLTIFYAGSVCVYDDVTPEKARAIMLLAGDGPSRANNAMIPAAPSPISWAPPRDGVVSPSSGPISTHVPPPPVASLVPSTSATSVGAASPARVSGVAVPVPQARKASLARFLEKRKERVLSASPSITTSEKNYPDKRIITIS